MEPIKELTHSIARNVEVVLTDIDDTLTCDGRLSSVAYQALWKLHLAGLRIIPVTGRSAGWCDCIARQWPVDAVIGENGAFALYRDAGSVSQFVHPEVSGAEHRTRLDEVRDAVLDGVPGSRVARDQPYRKFDLAIDFREDPPYLEFDVAERIVAVCRQMKAEAKISSIHVNIWFGFYDKLAMARLFLERILGIDQLEMVAVVAYCGDSPNDDPMFAHFPTSCGVGNIRETLHLIEHPPRYVTVASHGNGFAEFVDELLKKRGEMG